MRKYLFLLFIIIAGFSNSDLQKEVVELNWKYLSEQDINMRDVFKLSFDYAAYNAEFPEVPVYSKVMDLKALSKDFLYSIENPVFEEVGFEVSKNIIDKLDAEIQMNSHSLFSSGVKKSYLDIIPIKKEGDKVFILKSFELKRIPVSTKSGKIEGYAWKTQSVLKKGKWIKISIDETGLYKIPYSKLIAWGFSNPANVHVFGAGKAILNENPGEIEFDDLPQNSVWHGKNNGVDCLFFYANGNTEWSYGSSRTLFKHETNVYAKKSYYFLTEETGNSKLLESYSVVPDEASQTVSTANVYQVYEKDLVNNLESGRNWYGEEFRNAIVRTVSFDLPGYDGGDIIVRPNAIGRSTKKSDMVFSANEIEIGILKFSEIPGSNDSFFANEKTDNFITKASNSKLSIRIKYNAVDNFSIVDNNALAWLDYIEINYRRNISAEEKPLFWRDINSVSENNIIEINIENSSVETRLLDVTNPIEVKEVPLTLNGNIAKARRPSHELREYVVFNTNGSFNEPVFVGEIENQNLHAIETPEFLIISHNNFLNAAERLANFHRNTDNMKVEVIPIEKVYNEFSSGRYDATGIRNFIKMFYDRNQSLKYVLLFGDGSYDNKNINSNSKNFIPTYQSKNSLDPVSSFVTDDYFVLLDTDESVYKGAVDLGIGRIPSSTVYEADLVVDKIENYYKASALGDWRNIICFIADDQDEAQTFHTTQTETLAKKVNQKYEEFITDKIYLDAYQQEYNSGGQRYPEVTADINNRVNDGVLLLNYIGHANESYMADEVVLNISNVNSWSNKNKLSIFVTATCEFSRYDADETSIGEYVLMNPNGGGIGLFSTTRLVYSGANFLLSNSFYNYVFETNENGERYRMGDIIRLAKINTSSDINKRSFSLLADPALRLSYPKHKVITTSVNGKETSTGADTVGALQLMSFEGIIADYRGEKLDNFSGEIEFSVFDKEVVMHTLGNDANYIKIPFAVQENIIYKGIADVVNGEFSFSFITPKDISFEPGKGKIVYYANNGEEDAHGAFTNFVIGGSSSNSITDNQGPEIDLYMDNQNFVSGDKTGKSTTLIAYLSDESGISTVGTGIGHDITAVIDDDYSKVYVLNNFYSANKNDYTSGTVQFPFYNLPAGKHKLTLKAWDVANNSSEAVIEFEVSGEFVINEIRTQPNPAIDYTSFEFDHNQSGTTLDVVIEIFDQTGKRVDYISQQVGSSSTTSNPVRWNFNETQTALRSGIYVYRISAKNSEGLIAQNTGKLIIAR